LIDLQVTQETSTSRARFRDRWRHRADPLTGQSILYWHILVGSQPAVTDLAQMARQRIAAFRGFHITPLEWLHITTLTGGPADRISASGLQQVVYTASELLSDLEPVPVTMGKLLYHPEGIMLDVEPKDALVPVRDAVRTATSTMAGYSSMDDSPWSPHITLCYSTACQPAEPVMAALGPALPAREILIDTISLVIQHGPERRWDWQIVGTVHLDEIRRQGTLPSRRR
jgi:2'-5' RNA ligase